MNKHLKRFMIGAGLLFSAVFITGCTKSFCSVNDKASLYATYVENNQDSLLSTAASDNYFVPGTQFWSYIDTKVSDAVSYVKGSVGIDSATGEPAITRDPVYVPEDFAISNYKYDNTSDDAAKKGLVNDETLTAVIYYAGYNSDGNEETWANFDTWTADAIADPTVSPYSPTAAFLSYYKSAISSGVGNAVTCLTPTSGYFGLDQSTFVEGKTWGQAFTEYGPIEGLLVYPIGWLLYQFTLAFGVNGAGQILAIFLVTLIARFFIVLASAGSLTTQSRMSEIQPELAMIQARYPNSTTNKYEQQKMVQEQMALYKRKGIHPFRQIVVLIVQFPIFIAVWGALQGSAILTQGQVFGLNLSTVTYKAIFALGSEAPFAIVLFLMMAISQFFASMLPTWVQKFRKDRAVGTKTVKVNEDTTTGQIMKYMPLIMTVVILFMGMTLPSAMGIYWFFGALISILQTVLTELYLSFKKGRGPRNKDKYANYRKVDRKIKKKYMELR